MNAKQLSLRGLAAWFVVLAMILGGFGGHVQAKVQDAAAQNKWQKKDDKKDEKKDEKKGLTLKPARQIEFTTDEGTWLSLDVSPDGKSIVFELLGDIYTLPIEGGLAKLIDGGMAFDSQPKFSPDGKWIAFISDREGSENVWIMHPDGSGAKQVSKDPNNEFASPSWSPDGNYVFVVWHHYVRNLDVPRGRRDWGASYQGEGDADNAAARTRERHRSSGFSRRQVSLLCEAERWVRIQRAISTVANRAARPQDWRRRCFVRAGGEQFSAGAFARRNAASLRDEIRDGERAASAEFADWRRPLGEISDHSR
jgi:dipeptidyl aminopeptidase/acylaminoacyl peptidase